MKKILLGLLSLVVATTFAGCKSSSSGKEDCSNGNVIMVTDTGGIEDKSFNEGTYSGVKKLVEESDGVCSTAIESKTEADYEPNLSNSADKKPDLIIAAGYKFGDAMVKAATANPDQQFLLVDMVAFGEDGKQMKNVVSATFAEQEGSYLVGIAAAMKAKADGRDTVGFVGGEDSELINKFAAGYKAGVESVDPNMKVLTTFVGSFTDAAKGKLEAQKLYDQGAYIIYHAAGGSGQGVFNEAKERYTTAAGKGTEAQDGVWVIGVDEDQYKEGYIKDLDHSVVLTSMVKKVGTAAYDVSKDAIAGKFKGGKIITFDLANDGVGVPEENPNMEDKDILDAIEAAKKDIIDGKIEVPSTLK